MKRKPYNEFLGSIPRRSMSILRTTSRKGICCGATACGRVGGSRNGRVEVKARGKTGWVKKEDLGGESLLEVYFIDVGQGAGVLIKTPEFRHIMIDGGNPREKQNTGKNAAEFVDWKFAARSLSWMR
jgi:hypothetical protein